MTSPAEKRKRPPRKPPTRSKPLGKAAPPPPLSDWLAEYAEKAGLDAAALRSLRDWMAEQLVADEFAKLGQGGHTENRVPLRRVFVDLPISEQPVIEPERQAPQAFFLKHLRASRPYPLGALCASEEMAGEIGWDEAVSEPDLSDARTGGRSPQGIAPVESRGLMRRGIAAGWGGIGPAQAGTLLIGGPGQGKSTLGQLACQLHRAALLRPRASELPSQVRDILDSFDSDQDDELSAPTEPLFPLRIVLPEAAGWLSKRQTKAGNEAASMPTLLQFVADLPSARKSKLEGATLTAILAVMPFFLLLDGFDEVGAPEDRERIVDETREMLASLGAKKARAVVVATTRPQGYAGELARIGVPLLLRYLTPLRTEDALAYAAKLVNAKIQGADKQQITLARLQAAAKESASARLLRTPLQVTILAALVEQQGRAPSERWKLFWSYFDFTYRREIERDTYASELLASRRVHIESIHARAALLLQVEAETEGGGAARMSRDRLQSIVDTVLKEDEIAEEERTDLVRQIVDAAEKRLVFLVEPEPGSFGFEIRSLQEFFAAWALSDGREGAVEGRLLQVARAPMFRNVMLFVASRLFSERSALRDVLADRVCGSLDDDPNDVLACTTKVGALLALDVLEEGSVLQQPKRARALMERACGLLDLPPGRDHVKLTRLANEDTSPVLRAAIETRLIRASADDLADPLAPWLCLVEGANFGLDWAKEVGDEHWRLLKEPLRLLDACRSGRVPLGRWIVSKIAAQPEAFPPESFFDLQFDDRGGARSVGGSWVEVVVRKPHPPAPEFRALEEGWEYNCRPLPAGGHTDELAALAMMPSPQPNWVAWVAAARFVGAPSAGLLAEALRVTSQTLTVKGWNLLADWMPWPLAACLRAAETGADLERFAERLSNGELGDSKEWYRAEESWRQGSSLRAVIAAGSQAAPWAMRSLDAAPPLSLIKADLGPTTFLKNAEPLLDLAAAAFQRASLAPARSALAEVCFSALLSLPSQARPRLVEIGEWAKSARIVPTGLMHRPAHVTEPEWLRALDIFGARRLGRTSMGRWVVAVSYLEHPDNSGLLHWMTVAIPVGARLELSQRERLLAALKQVIEEQDYSTAVLRGDAAVLRTWLGAVTPSTIDSILQDISVWAKEEPIVWSRLFTSIRSGFLPAAFRETLALRAYEKMGPDHPFAHQAVDTMRALLQARVSGLGSPATWDRLELPLPYPLAPARTPGRTALPEKPVVLREVHVQHLRVLGDLKLELEPPPADKGQWTVLLGANGVGKTTLLWSLVLALRNLGDPAIWPKGTFVNAWHANGGPGEAKITVDAADHGKHVTRIRTNGSETFTQTPSQETPRLFPLFAYGCRRGSALGGLARAVDLNEDDGPEVATLFHEGAPLIHAQTWLIGLHSDAVSREQANVLLHVVLEALKMLLGLDAVEIREQGVWVSGPAVGRSIPLAALSDGYLTTAGWFLDLIARWITLAERHGAVITKDFLQEMTGLVLLDEIDLHLHPRWQVDVISRARDLLPRMSFVVTTHNPLTLVGAKPGEIRILTMENGKVRAEAGTESPMLLTGGQLFSRYFGIQDIYPNELGRKLRRYSFLSGYALRDDQEQADMVSLREELRKAGIETGWEEVPREKLPEVRATKSSTNKPAANKPAGKGSKAVRGKAS